MQMVTVKMEEPTEEQEHPLDELALDCSSGTTTAQCQLAARSNSYEAHADTLSAEALLQYIKASSWLLFELNLEPALAMQQQSRLRFQHP